jgi:hypothetical protein
MASGQRPCSAVEQWLPAAGASAGTARGEAWQWHGSGPGVERECKSQFVPAAVLDR